MAAVLTIPLVMVTSGDPAHAAVTTIWTEDFSSCTAPSGSTYEAGGTATAKAASPPIIVDLYNGSLLDCPDWTATGQAWMAVYRSGGSFPGGATRAAWLNEDGPGAISRTLTGLTIGRQYRISAEAWTDNYDGDTALGLETSTKTLTMPMSDGTGVQQVSISFCAASTSEEIRLFEDGDSYASPVVTNIVLDDMGQSCVQAVADTLTVQVGQTGTLDVVANDASAEGGSLPTGFTLTVTTGGTAGGSASFSGNTLRYVPLASEAGTTVTVTYLLCPPGETEGEPCSEGTVTITVLGQGDGGDTDGDGDGSGLTDAGLGVHHLLVAAVLLMGIGVVLIGARGVGSLRQATGTGPRA